MATLIDVKTQLANIESQFTIPLTDLAGMIDAARADLDATIGVQISDLEIQISDLQNQLMVLQGDYAAAEVTIQSIENTLVLVAKLKDTMASI